MPPAPLALSASFYLNKKTRLHSFFLHTYHSRFISKGEVSQKFFREIHVLPK
jgi:hypothetical protein